MRERKPGAAAALKYEGGIRQGAEYALHRVLDGKDEARRKLPQLFAGIHQGWGIRQEPEAGHEGVELLLPVRGIVFLHRRHGVGHPPEHAVGVLGNVTLLVLDEVPSPEDFLSVFSKFHGEIISKQALFG